MRLIAANPGLSLYEISKKLGMNMGTARYHLLILSINHKIAGYRADDKYVRYFTNRNSYSPRDQYVISLMRRENMGKALKLLLEMPGMSNVELSRALYVQESVVSRYMKELVKKGIVTRVRADKGQLAYSIKNEYRDSIVLAAEKLDRS